MEDGDLTNDINSEFENEETEKDGLLDKTGEPVKTNFDKFLDDVYRNEILFKINQEEEQFISDGVKTLATELILLTLALGEKAIEHETCRFQHAFPSLSVLKGGNSESNNLVEIGSFYEGTLNKFPNEFDYIFVLGTFMNDLPTRNVVRFNDRRYTHQFRFHSKDRDYHIHKVICAASELLKNRFITRSYDNVECIQHKEHRMTSGQFVRKIIFDKHIIVNESSAYLRFIYQNEYGKQIVINVHITPAFRVLESQQSRKTDERCSNFVKDQVSETGSVFVVDGLIWFAQSEVNFMNNAISRKHKKVFRIVKYLVGEKKDIEALERKFTETGLWRYNAGLMTSYMIKVGVMLHHYDCKHIENESEAACVLDILNYLKNIKSDSYFKGLTEVVYKPNFFRSEDRYTRLRDMIQLFESMQLSSEPYAYERCSVCPINKGLLKYFDKCQGERSHKPDNIGTPLEEPDGEIHQERNLMKHGPAIFKLTFGLLTVVVIIVAIVVFTT